MLLLTTVLAYRTRRYHHIVCENSTTLWEVCASRFEHTNTPMGLEPNWGIYKQRVIQYAEYEQMRHGNLCPVCMDWHTGPRCKVGN